MPPDFRDVDPSDLRVPPSRSSGADPAKLQRQIAQFGASVAGMPPLWVYEAKDWRPSAMIEPMQQDILRSLAARCELSPGVRFGQLLANLGFLAEDMSDCTLWDIEDAELLRVVERHRADLSQRQPTDSE